MRAYTACILANVAFLEQGQRRGPEQRMCRKFETFDVTAECAHVELCEYREAGRPVSQGLLLSLAFSHRCDCPKCVALEAQKAKKGKGRKK